MMQDAVRHEAQDQYVLRMMLRLCKATQVPLDSLHI